MKKLTLLLSFVLAAGVASAASKKAPSAGPATAATTGKTHQVSAEVVSADMTKHTITIKADDGTEKTAPVEGKALAALKSVKPGEKVTLTCRDNAQGEHQAVTAIHPAAHPAKATATQPVGKP